jgi:Uma2 family endonuclease
LVGIEFGSGFQELVIPPTVVDHASYLKWVHSDNYPEKAQTAWLAGILWVETEMEDVFAHGLVKTEVAAVLSRLVREADAGYLSANGVLVSNLAVDLSNEPDATFVSYDAIRSGRVELVPGKRGGIMELRGSPDMVLEVVNRSSVLKDTERLRNLYYRAGILEYWLVDARGTELKFDIFHLGPKGYVATRKRGGFLRSAVFNRGFRLDRGTDRLGHPQLTLVVG